jgi:hypothetical protein
MKAPIGEDVAENIVIKVGGASLFGGPRLVEQIRKAITPESNQRVFVIFGGGDTIESMRSLHTLYPHLDSVAMHWRCIRLLDATWEVACELFRDGLPTETWDNVQRATDGPFGRFHLVRVSAFYSRESLSQIPSTIQPSQDWSTTSDVLSWLLAMRIGAAELRIAKRCFIDSSICIHDAAAAGMIDPELARLSAKCLPSEQPKILFMHLGVT